MKRLITAALPYVNNVPHLGNLIQVLSADVFAQFCRLRGYETLYICGTDEYGTATETKALKENISEEELCSRYFEIHKNIYSWFNIRFDHFDRTSTKEQTELVQEIFLELDKAGYINDKTIEQMFCESCSRFLADRYIHGHCPNCGYEEARGDQCDQCGKLLNPVELKEPSCGVCGSRPVVKETLHLFLDLEKLSSLLKEWFDNSHEGWSRNAVNLTLGWFKEGLQERGISRDLKWGVPIPKKGFEHKVFYVWFDAPIGYISITKRHIENWESWWLNPKEVNLFQFIGKDNVPFHSIFFPASLLGTGKDWTLVSTLSSSEYLNYEDSKFSKTHGIGIFGDDCQKVGIPSDIWRFYLMYNRPEKGDYQFLWSDFKSLTNNELIGNLGNFVNRTITFINKFYSQDKYLKLLNASVEEVFCQKVREYCKNISQLLEGVKLREAFREIFHLSSYGNRYFQDNEPWQLVKEDKEKGASILKGALFLVRDLGILINPFMPSSSQKILELCFSTKSNWSDLGSFSGIERIGEPSLLFSRLEDEFIEELREQFNQKKDENDMVKEFIQEVDIRIGQIISIEKHPDADKLYIEKIECGEEEPRTIVSGLASYYREEELIGKKIALVSNLKPAKIRGIKSFGMLLACSEGDNLEVVSPNGEVGERLLPKDSVAVDVEKRISIDRFFEFPLKVTNHVLSLADGRVITDSQGDIFTSQIANGEVG